MNTIINGTPVFICKETFEDWEEEMYKWKETARMEKDAEEYELYEKEKEEEYELYMKNYNSISRKLKRFYDNVFYYIWKKFYK